MSRYVASRALQAVLTAFGVLVLVFFMLRLTGDPSSAILPKEATIEQRETFRHEMGFDRPILVQLADYLADIARGDFGLSYKYRLPVLTLILERLPATVELALAGMTIAIILGVTIGVLGATRPGSIWEALTDLVGVVSLSTPTFWAGLIFILVFSVNLRLFPVAGRSQPRSLVLPAVTMSLLCLGQLVRLTRATMREVLRQDYIQVARAKGLTSLAISYRHALRNAAIPIVTLIGINLGYMLGGSIIVETVFSWPGVGWLTYQAVGSRDFVLVQAVALFTAWVVLLLNLVTDILYGLLDPRIAYGRNAGAR